LGNNTYAIITPFTRSIQSENKPNFFMLSAM
jgi:hypothetical protein